MHGLEQTIKFENEGDPDFARMISDKSGCDRLSQCIQCGTCSGTCPLSIYMDHPPRKIIGLTRDGFKNEVLKSNSIWLCASCYSCRVECPKEIKVTDILYALKRTAIQEKIFPENLSLPVLAREFFSMVRQHGRVNETILGAKFLLKTSPWKVFGMLGLGLKLLWTGRFGFVNETIEHTESLRKLLDKSHEEEVSP